MRVRRLSLVVALAALALAGCGSRGDLYTRTLHPLPLLATAEAMVQIVPETNHAVLVAPDLAAPKAVRISAGARKAAVAPGGNLAVILAGDLKRPVLDLLAVKAGEVRTLEIPGVFDEITFAPEGDRAVLSYSADSHVSGLAARNLNELAVVDLIAATATRIQLDTESLAPRQVIFARKANGRQKVAVVLDRGVAVFDALHPEAPARRISVRPQGSRAETTLLEALFSSDGAFLFLRASGIDDVIVIELGVSDVGEITAAVNFVAGGTGLSDIDVPTSPAPANSVLAVYTGSREAVLLDARGIEDNALRLPLTDALSHIQALPGGKAMIFDAAFRSVVAWDLTTKQSGVAVLDSSSLDAPFITEPLGKAVFRHPAGMRAGAAFSVVSMEEIGTRVKARIQSIQLASSATTVTLDGPKERLFYAVKSGAEPLLGRLDLRSLEVGQVKLDADVVSLHHLAAKDVIAVVHGGNDYGDITFVPAGNLERSAAVRMTSFALTGDLDRPEEK